jgi:hypothetical protein
MSITYNWVITEMVVCNDFGYTNVVNSIKYTCVGTDDANNMNQFSGSAILPLPESGDFTPYQNVTEQQAYDWLWYSLGADGKTAIETTVAQQFVPPTPQPPLPWSN